MECTQRLECTQDLYDTHTERVCPEQIGFLGICGAKHPIMKGPNKIGRDPQTCSIVLNMNSISRQHAVINILSQKEFMLMDLDSSNKTKLLNLTLKPYIPEPLRDGDTVQFGDIFGIFRLLEDNDELPMTQAIDLPMTQPIDIPETPLLSKGISKLNKGQATMIPESPDVSDKEDSFITSSQQKHSKSKLSSESFIKSFGKSIPIHPISIKKDISNDSSRKNTSINSPKMSDSSIDADVNKNLETNKNVIDNIHDANTQVPDSILNAPSTNESTDSIYMADTQIPLGASHSPSIHNLDTQVPAENLPQVFKVDDQGEMQIDICLGNKENDLSIYNADTQPFDSQKVSKKDIVVNKNKETVKSNSKAEQSLNRSDDELLFEEIEDECLEEFYSQPLLPQESPTRKLKSSKEIDSELPTQKIEEKPFNEQPRKFVKKVEPEPLKKTNGIESDSSTDCEDIEIIPTQKIPELPLENDIRQEKIGMKAAPRHNRINSDSSTDCEDIDLILTQKVELKKDSDDFAFVTRLNPRGSDKEVGIDGKTELEDMPTQVVDLDPDKIEDMSTQIVTINDNDIKSNNEINFEDQPTQLIEEIIPNTSNVKTSLNNLISPFKVPLPTPIKVRNKETSKNKTTDKEPIDPDNYYDATQDILDDLCTQRDGNLKETLDKSNSLIIIDDDIVPCSVEDYETARKFANIDEDLSPVKKSGELKLPIASLSRKEVRDIIGVDDVSKIRKYPSDSSSDIETTPRKIRPCIFTDSDLPNSQEIETSRLVRHTNLQEIESSSESEPDENTEEQHTPFLYKKKKAKPSVKIDLTKKFDVEKLPERIITRVRKPTAKMEENLQMDKKASNILKPNFLADQEDQINEDIIKENVKRLKSYERTRNSKEVKNESTKKEDSKVKTQSENDVKNEKKQNKIEKNNELKEKIKVKIQKPKKKDTDKSNRNKDSSASKSIENSSTIKSKAETRKKKDIDKNSEKEESLLSKSDDQLNTRSKRARKKEKEVKSVEKKDVSPQDKKKEPEGKPKRPSRKREQPKKSASPEVEIRRSKRQVNVKEKKSDNDISQPKSILKKNIHDQSTVYNLSTGRESPKNLKRPLDDEIEVPSSKRTRAVVNNENNKVNSVSLRATPARTMRSQHVLFTAFPSEEVKQKLEKLGAVIVTDVMQCTVVLTMQIKRTFKLLCAVGLGRPIVGPSWVQACVDTRMIVDPWLYLIKDEQAEKRFQFALDRTLNGKRNFLKGYNISSTTSVQPNCSEMKLIVECSGGTWKEGGSNWVCVSCTKDQASWPALRKRGAIIVSTEFILGGVLKQKIDINSNKFP